MKYLLLRNTPTLKLRSATITATLLAVMACLLLALPQGVYSQQGGMKDIGSATISIKALDDYTQQPVSQALVELYKGQVLLASTYTDQDGEAILNHPTGVQQQATHGTTHAFPNPTANHINLPLHTVKHGPIRISVYNALGQHIISKQQTITAGTQLIRTNLEGLPEGVYLMIIWQGNTSQTHKIIKQQTASNLPPTIHISPQQQQHQTHTHKETNNYSITIQREDYDKKQIPIATITDLELVKHLSRNNQVTINAQTQEGEPKSLNLLFDQEEITTPHQQINKSGIYQLRSNKDHLLPTSTEIASQDTTLVLKEQTIAFLYPNNQPIENLQTIINNQEKIIDKETTTHVLNQNYNLTITDPRIEPQQKEINFQEQPTHTLQERITVNA